MVFWAIIPRRHKLPDIDVAVPVIIRHVSCPHCGNVFSIMTLGSLRSKVVTEPFIYDSKGRRHPNPDFRETHLGNPITCPVCGRNFIAFVGVEYDDWNRNVKGVHVKLMKPEDPAVRELVRWPHAGLVDPMVIEYKPSEATIYHNLEHFQEYNEDTSDIKAVSLPSNGVPSNIVGSSFQDFGEGGNGRGRDQGYPPPRRIPMGFNLRSRRLYKII